MERALEEAKKNAKPAVYRSVLAVHRAPDESGDFKIFVRKGLSDLTLAYAFCIFGGTTHMWMGNLLFARALIVSFLSSVTIITKIESHFSD